MNRLLKTTIALGVVSGFALCAQSVNSAGVGYMTQAKVMSEYKHGDLKSGSGGKVKSRKQAVAIALSEARSAGAKIPKKKKS